MDKSRFSAKDSISEMMQDRALVTMECEQKAVPKLTNGTILTDRE